MNDQSNASENPPVLSPPLSLQPQIRPVHGILPVWLSQPTLPSLFLDNQKTLYISSKQMELSPHIEGGFCLLGNAKSFIM